MYLFQGRMEISFPREYRLLSSEEVRALFPGREKPQTAVKGEGETYLAFSLTEKQADSSGLSDILDDFCFLIKKRYPENIFFEKERMDTETGTLVWSDFRGNTFSSQRYCLLFLTCIDKRLLVGLFQCRWSEMRRYKHQILELLRGIADTGKSTSGG